jgi:hypothetical protein
MECLPMGASGRQVSSRPAMRSPRSPELDVAGGWRSGPTALGAPATAIASKRQCGSPAMQTGDPLTMRLTDHEVALLRDPEDRRNGAIASLRLRDDLPDRSVAAAEDAIAPVGACLLPTALLGASPEVVAWDYLDPSIGVTHGDVGCRSTGSQQIGTSQPTILGISRCRQPAGAEHAFERVMARAVAQIAVLRDAWCRMLTGCLAVGRAGGRRERYVCSSSPAGVSASVAASARHGYKSARWLRSSAMRSSAQRVAPARTP